MTACPVRRRALTEGMTLIEVLVAILIFSVGATSLIALFAAASATHKRGVDRTHAALIAEEIFSEVQARYIGQADLESLIADLEDDVPERIDGYAWSLILHRPGDGSGKGSKRSSRYKEDRGPWSRDELVVRIDVKWGRGSAGAAAGDVYTTILLPRPTPSQRSRKRGR